MYTLVAALDIMCISSLRQLLTTGFFGTYSHMLLQRCPQGKSINPLTADLTSFEEVPLQLANAEYSGKPPSAFGLYVVAQQEALHRHILKLHPGG